VNFEKMMLRTVVEKLKLRRMRFKVDPAISNLEDFDGNTSYEGYILNENEGVLNILVVDPNNQVRQTAVFSNAVNVLSNNLVEFKRNLVRIILKKVPEQVLEQIQNASTFDEVEQLATQNGATEDDIKNAYRSFNTESTLNEQGILGRAAQKAKDVTASAVSKVPGAQSSGLIRRGLGKAADIGKEVAFGKDAKTLGQKAWGAANIMGRVGETLKKFGPKGSRDFEFKDRSGFYHKDKPRIGQKFEISYSKNKKDYQITATVSGEKTSGNKTFIQLRNVSVNPPFEDYEKVNGILVEFGLNSPRANFHVYDDSNKLRDGFSTKLQYDNSTKTWEGIESDKTEEINDDEKQPGRKVVASKANIKSLADTKGYESFQEPYGQKRILFKIKGEKIYFDSNHNRQTPKLEP